MTLADFIERTSIDSVCVCVCVCLTHCQIINLTLGRQLTSITWPRNRSVVPVCDGVANLIRGLLLLLFQQWMKVMVSCEAEPPRLVRDLFFHLLFTYSDLLQWCQHMLSLSAWLTFSLNPVCTSSVCTDDNGAYTVCWEMPFEQFYVRHQPPSPVF